MQSVWYVLIHVSLGLIGWKLFVVTNLGVLAAFAVCAAVQSWPMYELYRLTWGKFYDMRGRIAGEGDRRKETRAYWLRMGRLFFFRSCAYTFLTLVAAWLMRG